MRQRSFWSLNFFNLYNFATSIPPTTRVSCVCNMLIYIQRGNRGRKIYKTVRRQYVQSLAELFPNRVTRGELSRADTCRYRGLLYIVSCSLHFFLSLSFVFILFSLIWFSDSLAFAVRLVSRLSHCLPIRGRHITSRVQ